MIYLAGLIQTGESISKCNKLIFTAQTKSSNEYEAKLVAYTYIDCIEKNNGLFASLFFNKSEVQKSYRYTKN